ncbi:hypothetical protein BO70DRAFT_392549 [Aspergillus heteromorphus CBS 117.55]|uniref:DUF8035 domain-containing protein n=1 Tax=Aspergillus heteromorphus CBS 117.55 TaxID=1448321 RepID=A0A317X2V3_9EURO|nr:uncharacterized protein BO70DRAFT_392549 [Aspergillus heteromorphus CBS 117.55]PWY90880.1 hypothetical protein BO70DRAFT_392549 [Aspergillus heteromorphus CBS 117.55]
MGPAARYRPMSPSGSRMGDPMRASTGTVQLSASYDPYNLTTSRPAYSSYHPDVKHASSYDPRSAREPRLEAQPISSTTYRDPGHSTKLRTEYAIRPRARSNTTSSAETRFPPGRYDAPASPLSRTSPVIISAHHRSPSPHREQERYVVPASSHKHHRRHPLSHTDYASDTGRLDPNDREARARMAHGAYPSYEHSHRWRYPPTGGLRKGQDIDDYDAYSYTSPREQFEKDSVARLRHDRSAYPRERPLSLTGVDDPQLMPRKESRALGPPPSQRGFGKLDHGGRVRRSNYGSADSDVDLSSARRRSWQRAPVSLHQDVDEGYSSHRDDYDHGHHRHYRPRRHEEDVTSRHSYDDRAPRRSSIAKGAGTSAPGTGLGTAVLASGYSDFEHDRSRTDRHRSRERGSRDHEHRQHHSRSRRRSRRRTGSGSDWYSSDEDLKKYQREPSAHRKLNGSDLSASGSDRPPQYLAIDPAPRHRSHSRHRTEEMPRSREAGTPEVSSRPEEPAKADSVTSKDQEAPAPKGILKAPRERFPEEPNPVREGVAPLKDAHKKGIPPGARWTKIDRRLVNPAALEVGRERYEERSEYVIVLRVLTKEEIQAYAVKTQEIRDARYQEVVRERRRRRDEDRRRGRTVDNSSSDDEEEDASPLAIEGPPDLKGMPRASTEPAKAKQQPPQ